MRAIYSSVSFPSFHSKIALPISLPQVQLLKAKTYLPGLFKRMISLWKCRCPEGRKKCVWWGWGGTGVRDPGILMGWGRLLRIECQWKGACRLRRGWDWEGLLEPWWTSGFLIFICTLLKG